LNACFMVDVSWPRRTDLVRLWELVPMLYKETGRVKTAPIFWNMIKAVDKQWPGPKLVNSLERLVARFVKNAPQSPGLRLLHHLESGGKSIDPEKGHPLFKLLDQIYIPRNTMKWTDLSNDLDKLISDDTRAAIGTMTGQPEALAWIRFMDVHRQALIWRIVHRSHHNQFLQWVYGLGNDKLTELLQFVAWGTDPLPTTADWRAARKRSKARIRKRKSRAH